MFFYSLSFLYSIWLISDRDGRRSFSMRSFCISLCRTFLYLIQNGAAEAEKRVFNLRKNCSMPNYQDLQAQIASLQAQAEEMRQQEIAAVIQEIKEKIALYTLKAEDLGFRPMQRARTAKNAPLAAKYQNSKTGETWSGHGRAPKWISGKPKEKFLISQ